MEYKISLRKLLFTNQHGVIYHQTWISKEGRKEQTNKQTKWERKKEKKKESPPTVIFKQMRLLYTFAWIILKSFLLENVTQSILIPYNTLPSVYHQEISHLWCHSRIQCLWGTCLRAELNLDQESTTLNQPRSVRSS